MNKLKVNKKIFIVTILIFIILISFRAFNISDTEALNLNSEEETAGWVNFYHNNPCGYSLFEILNSYNLNYDISIRYEPRGSVECFGKNFWIDYTPEKKVADGWKQFSPRKFVIRIATNLHIDLILQSLVWLVLLSFIPKHEKNLNILNKIPIIIGVLLLYLHYLGESKYYSTIGRDYYPNLFYRDYDNSFLFDNYFLYTYLLIFIYFFYILNTLLASRMVNLINYFPFVFCIYGTYTSLNLNFFVIVLSYLGVISLFNKKANLKFLLIYLLFFSIWLINSENLFINFDVDKIKGFVNTSQSNLSLFYWGITFFLVLTGVSYLVSISKNYINLDLITKNLLFSSALLVVFGLVGAINKPINFLSFYILGQNKNGMSTLQSVEGNSWRGFFPSAEAVGEFYGFVILFTLIMFITRNFNLKMYHLLFLMINIYGLYRANNASAIITLLFLFLIVLIKFKVSNKKKRNMIYLFIITIIMIGGIYLIVNKSFGILSGSVMFEAVKASDINYDFQLNEYNKSAVEEANYALLLSLPPENTNFSNSLAYLLNSYTYGNKIDNLPSALSLVSSFSYFINRSEKWGIFVAKYNPNILEFVFGYGPNQLAEYYLGHETVYQDGLVLPHSTLLMFLIFFGSIGLLFLLSLIFYYLKENHKGFYLNTLVIYFLINFIKSDSGIYFSTFLTFLILINFVKEKSLLLINE